MARVSLARNRVKTGRYITNLEIFTHNQLPRGSRFCEHSYDRNNRTSGQIITSRNGNFVFISMILVRIGIVQNLMSSLRFRTLS